MSLSIRLTTVTVKIPEDVLLEILARLPLDSVMRYKCVSKLWYSLISSRYFANLFLKFSSRRVFVYTKNYKLFSSSPRNLVVTSSFPPLNLDQTLPDLKKDRLEFVNAVRGLMCFRVGRQVKIGIRREIRREIRIINFTTRQVLSLTLRKPNIFLESDSSMEDYESMWNYFGYDSLKDEYKVLSTISSVSETVRSETQVLVLGTGASWRNTKSGTSPSPHHLPYSKGISINGVLYYGAWSHEERCVMMSFDFSSEEFNLIEFPKEAHIEYNKNGFFHKVNLMNYQDQVALLDGSPRLNTECNLVLVDGSPGLNTECILVQNLWVLEDVGKSKWSRKFFVLPCRQLGRIFGTNNLGIRGTSRSGEVMLSGRYKHAIYDLEKKRIIKGFVINPSFDITLWDDVESIMALEA